MLKGEDGRDRNIPISYYIIRIHIHDTKRLGAIWHTFVYTYPFTQEVMFVMCEPRGAVALGCLLQQFISPAVSFRKRNRLRFAIEIELL